MDKPTQYQPDLVTPPGDTLQETLEALGMSPDEFAARTELPIDLLNQILEGTARITTEEALAFAKVIGTSAQFWLNREENYQAFLARSTSSNHSPDSGKMVNQATT